MNIRIGPRGVSVRTGLGLTLRISALSQRLELSDRKQAILHIRDELEKLGEISDDFCIRCDHANIWNGKQIDYPSENYDICRAEIESLVESGREIESYLRELATLASEHRTGLTTTLRKSMSELRQPMGELERFLSQLIALAAGQVPPASPNEPPLLPPSQRTVRLDCYQCYAKVEATAADSGKTMSCPNCGCALLVP
jgi:hypothetical protein